MAEDALVRVFWPLDYTGFVGEGVLVGWRNSELDVFVVAILPGLSVRDPCGWEESGVLTVAEYED